MKIRVNTLHTASAGLQRARNLLAAATEQAQLAAVAAANDGIPETTIAKELGVQRMTVRSWLGK